MFHSCHFGCREYRAQDAHLRRALGGVPSRDDALAAAALAPALPSLAAAEVAEVAEAVAAAQPSSPAAAELLLSVAFRWTALIVCPSVVLWDRHIWEILNCQMLFPALPAWARALTLRARLHAWCESS